MKKRKGLTLLEVVISMALIGMVAVVFLSIFTTGNSNIFKAGKRTTQILSAQEKIDSKIKTNSDEGIEEVEVNIPGIATIKIKGTYVTETEDGITITTFVPNKDVPEEGVK